MIWPPIGWVALVAGAAGVGLAAEPMDPAGIVNQLAAGGPRAPGLSGHRAAQELLTGAMVDLGLAEVQPVAVAGAAQWTHLTGLLPGGTGREIVLSAHYDTVAESVGVVDNASGCAAALDAVGSLSRNPRRHAVRLVLTDGEEQMAAGSQAWLSRLPAADRQKLLANVNLDMVGDPIRDRGVLHLVVGEGGAGRSLTPAWLVNAALQAAAATGFDLAVQDRRWSWWAQLAMRCATPTRVSDGRRFLEAGIAALTLSDLAMTDRRVRAAGDGGGGDSIDAARLQAWGQMVAATLRRLDSMETSPVAETDYLVVGGRVWIRRDLVWIGFVIWVSLVWQGLPGRWRQQPIAARRQLGRAYLPGFTFRMLLLLSVFMIPAFTVLLLAPAALLALGRSLAGVRRPRLFCLLGLLPTLAFALWLAAGQLVGWFVIDRTAILPIALVGLTLATFCVWQLES